jgi:acyl carrier protein
MPSCSSFISTKPENRRWRFRQVSTGAPMNREEGAIRLTRIMRDIFDSDDVQYRDGLTINSVPGWDSLGHMRFLNAVEKDFGVEFTSGEVDTFENAGNVLDALLLREARV